MNMQHNFAAGETRAAMHCDELIARRAEAVDGLAGFGKFGKALAPLVAKRFQSEFATTGLVGIVAEPEMASSAEINERVGAIAGNFKLPVGDAGGRLLASFALSPIASRLASMFGGGAEGFEPQQGQKLPSSMTMLLRRLADALTSAIGECLDEAAMCEGDTSEFATDLAELAAFPGYAQAAVMKLTFEQEGQTSFEVLLACRKSMIGRLLTHFDGGDAAAPSKHAPSSVDGSLVEIPVPLRARLAQMKLPMSRLMTLKAGDTLPLAVSRSVPLFVGGVALASGSIGEQDDRVALQIDKIFNQGEAM